MKRDVTIQFRATEIERDAWQSLAKPYSLSEYIRQLLLKEQERRLQGESWHVDSSAA